MKHVRGSLLVKKVCVCGVGEAGDLGFGHVGVLSGSFAFPVIGHGQG